MMRRSKEVSNLIESSMPVIMFIHVPKTGGTDLAIKLQESMRFNVFALDAPEEDYKLQLEWFSSHRPTFIRAHIYYHHAWDNFLKWHNNVQVFTIIRNPYSLHVSLATMLLERNLREAGGDNVTMSPVVPQCEYVGKLLSIIESPEYLNSYQNIYTKYFSRMLKKESLLNRLRVIDIDQVDELQQRLIPDDAVLSNPRLNQARCSLELTSTELLNSDLMLGLSQLVSPEEIRLYKKLQRQSGNVLWAPSAKSLSEFLALRDEAIL